MYLLGWSMVVHYCVIFFSEFDFSVSIASCVFQHFLFFFHHFKFLFIFQHFDLIT